MAVKEDAPEFAKWVANNPDIPSRDVQAGLSKNNPTALCFVAEKDGKAVAFAPLHLAAVLDYLGLSPDASAADKLRALKMLQDGVSHFMLGYGVSEIQTLSQPEYGIAKWAVKNHFEEEPRKLFRLNLSDEIAREQELEQKKCE
jgi:hypothetical protein